MIDLAHAYFVIQPLPFSAVVTIAALAGDSCAQSAPHIVTFFHLLPLSSQYALASLATKVALFLGTLLRIKR